MRKLLKLGTSIVVCLLVGGFGTIFSISSIPTWYTSLHKPFFNPPNWIFGPVWTILYVLIGISFYLIWKKGIKSIKVRSAINLFVIQLGLNAIWTPVFFGMHNPPWAFVIILLMIYFSVLTIISFKKINKLAAYLLYPYLIWIIFAAALNFSIWLLNK